MKLKPRELVLSMLKDLHDAQLNKKITDEALTHNLLALQTELLLDIRDLILNQTLATGQASVEGAIIGAKDMDAVKRMVTV